MKQIFVGIIMAFSLFAVAKNMVAVPVKGVIGTGAYDIVAVPAKDVIEITNKAGKPADPVLFLGVIASDPDLSDWFANRTKEKSVILQGITELEVSPPKFNDLNQAYCSIKEVTNESSIGLLGVSGLNQRCINGIAKINLASASSHEVCVIHCYYYGSGEVYYPIPLIGPDCEYISPLCVRCCYDHPSWIR